MESPQGFVEEIDVQELSFHEVVGKGAFGVVSRAIYRSKDVAVKLIETESERKAFLTELKQLSRVNHPNIVKLYGACTRAPVVCLVMEYAEGGSLYNVLHGTGPQPDYTAAHAMSWALQVSRGVEYLHSMKPKALIHRDLKPPNLLLIMGGTVLKICDFGTACDIQTHMTNNKGSAAWMAPEVFEGSNYSEKCDVFSWGIILWEILTRRKPFDEIGGPAFRIMWAVHNGTRPPLIRNLPKPLELLMTRCWSGKPAERPSMAEVVRIMSYLFQFFSGADKPLVYPEYPDNESLDYTFIPATTNSQFGTQFTNPPSTGTSSIPQTSSESQSRTSTYTETVRHSGDYITHSPYILPRANPPVVVEEENRGQKSAPPSLAASRESLIGIQSPRSGTPVDLYQKRYSADLTKLEEYDIMSQGASPTHPKVLGHRRAGSHGNTVTFTQAGIPIIKAGNIPHAGRGHRRIGSDEYSGITHISHGIGNMMGLPSSNQSPVHHVSTYPGSLTGSRETTPTPHQGSLSGSREATPPYRQSISYNPPGVTENVSKPSVRSASWTSEVPIMPPLSVEVDQSNMMNMGPSLGMANLNNILSNPLSNQAMSLVYQSLDHQYQPIPPCPTNQESMDIFHKHCVLAQQYLKYQTEVAMFEQTRHELLRELDMDVLDQQSTTQLQEEYRQLMKENESLKSFHKNLTKQLEQIRKNQNQTKRHGAA